MEYGWDQEPALVLDPNPVLQLHGSQAAWICAPDFNGGDLSIVIGGAVAFPR